MGILACQSTSLVEVSAGLVVGVLETAALEVHAMVPHARAIIVAVPSTARNDARR
jgi:hypothetical protein